MSGDILNFSDFLKAVNTQPTLKRGCLVDTSILFAYAYPNDRFNKPSTELFDYLRELEVPLFTNANIRSEFINNYFQSVVPEALNDFYQYSGLDFSEELRSKLASNYATLYAARKSGNSYKFNSNKVDEWRKLLRKNNLQTEDGWYALCSGYASQYLSNVWESTCEQAGVNFLTLRGSDAKAWMTSSIEWSDMVSIIGNYGIGSSDAMIVNLFMNSHFEGIFTADIEMAKVISKISNGKKLVFVPDRMVVQ